MKHIGPLLRIRRCFGRLSCLLIVPLLVTVSLLAPPFDRANAQDAPPAPQTPDWLQSLKTVKYATPWIDISPEKYAGRSRTETDIRNEQVSSVTSTIVKLYKQFSKEGHWASTDDVVKLNARWEQEKVQHNRDYLNALFDKENEFRTNFQDMMQLKQKLNQYSQDLTTRNQRIKTLQRQKRAAERNIRIFEEWKAAARNNFLSRMANIPYSVLLVGRVRWNDAIDLDAQQKIITNRMITEALKLGLGEQISSNVELKNNELVQYVITKEIKGTAHVSDTYFKTLVKFFSSTGERWVYQIHRIDVFPFSEGEPRFDKAIRPSGNTVSVERQQTIERNVEVFRPRIDHRLQNVTTGAGTSWDDHLLRKEADYLSQQLKLEEQLNQGLENEARKLAGMFQGIIDDYNGRIAAARARLADIEADMSREKEQVAQRTADTKKLYQDIAHAQGQYNKAKQSYEEVYKHKSSFVGRLEQSPPRASFIKTFEEMTLATFAEAERVQQQDQKNTILADLSGGKDQELDMNQQTVEYKAKIRAFRVLYLTQQADDEGNAVCLLNLGYQIDWTSDEETAPTDRPPPKYIADDDTSAGDATPVPNHTDHRLSIDTDHRLLVDREQGFEWKFSASPDEFWSYRSQGPRPDGSGWALPTIEQLKRLAELIGRYRRDTGNDVFQALNWPVHEGVPYVSQTQERRNGDILLSAYDFANQTQMEVDDMAVVYIVWVRRIP